MRAPDGRQLIALDAAPTSAPTRAATETAEGEDAPITIRVLGYRQTAAPAARGGVANRKGFRVRPDALAALAASFAGAPFLTDHDWGDVRARGGTVRAAAVVDLGAGERGIEFTLELTADWALEALEEGNLTAFSIGAIPSGATLCTVHGGPVFDACYCLPGEQVEVKGGTATAEWEHEAAEGVELSAVNVAAVVGTGQLVAGVDLDELEALVGRQHRPAPVVLAPIAPPPSTSPPTAAIAAALGLAADVDPATILASVAALAAGAAAAKARADELELATHRQHVEAALDRLVTERAISFDVLVDLRTLGLGGDRATFDAAISLATRTAPDRATVAPRSRPVLQSDAPPATLAGDNGGEPDAYEQIRSNPAAAWTMRACGLTPSLVREHGPRGGVVILSNLGELIAATEAKGG
jgi:hypothetical protein